MKAFNDNLVCIANVVTGEVLRIPSKEAYTEFTSKQETEWYYTTKQIYKQYVDSKKPESKIPAPLFIKEVEDEKGNKVSKLFNVYVGHPSYRVSRKNSSYNKKGKHRYQTIAANTITNTKGEEEFREARVIRHNNY